MLLHQDRHAPSLKPVIGMKYGRVQLICTDGGCHQHASKTKSTQKTHNTRSQISKHMRQTYWDFQNREQEAVDINLVADVVWVIFVCPSCVHIVYFLCKYTEFHVNQKEVSKEFYFIFLLFIFLIIPAIQSLRFRPPSTNILF